MTMRHQKNEKDLSAELAADDSNTTVVPSPQLSHDAPSGEFASIAKQIQAEAGRYLAWLNSSKPLNDEYRMIKGRIVTLACKLLAEGGR
jgi:hypothetical protein